VEPHRLSRPRPTILVVEDHSDFREALGVLLEHEGYRIADASNGAEALVYLRSGAPVSSIILDLDMPVMNGWDFLAECRRHSTWSTIPTLVVTGISIAERRRNELGAVEVFTKPFNFDELLATVRRAMIREVPGPA
jgi:CheY-like chemotaxis protein